jgi:hypothetical protein
MKARRDCQKVREECKKHVSRGQKVLSCVLCELSGIPSSLSCTLQSFEVDHEEMTDTLSDTKQNKTTNDLNLQCSSNPLIVVAFKLFNGASHRQRCRASAQLAQLSLLR